VIIFLCAFFGVAVFQTLQTLAQPEVRPGYIAGWRDRQLEFDVEFLLAAFAVPLVGWFGGLPNRNAIIRAIQARP
jgi:hypothetical protein